MNLMGRLVVDLFSDIARLVMGLIVMGCLQ